MSHHRSNPLAALGLAGALLFGAGDATALTQWTLALGPGPGFFGWDDPTFTLANTSTAGETITDLSITIGDTSYHFDAVGAAHPSEAVVGATLLSPDRSQSVGFGSAGRSDTLAWSFAGFDAGESFTFSVDLDLDGSFFGSWTDARAVLFNNDFPFGDPNAVVSATFSDGSVAALTLPDGPWTGGYAFASGPGSGGSASGGASVPEPRAAGLLAAGLLGLAWLGGRRPPAGP